MTELIAIATKVYNNRETPEDKQVRGLAKVLLADKSCGPDGQREHRLSQMANGQCPQRKKGQEVLDWQVQTIEANRV